MKSIKLGILGVAFFGFITSSAAAKKWNSPEPGFSPPDSLEIPGVLAVFEPGVLVRTRYAENGSELHPVKEVVGTFVQFSEDAFQVEVKTNSHRELHQFAIDDVLRLELGIERRLTIRGAVLGGLTGALLGVAATAAGGDHGDAFDSRGAEYAAGTAIFGLLGAGVGALIGRNTETVEWRSVPLYGSAYVE